MAGSGIRVGNRQFSSNEVWSFVVGIILGQIIFGVIVAALFVFVVLLDEMTPNSFGSDLAAICAVALSLAVCAGIGMVLGRTRGVPWASIAGIGAASAFNALRVTLQTSGSSLWLVGVAAFCIALGMSLVGGYALGTRDDRAVRERALPPGAA